jgi:hypothetical protein
MLTMSTDLAEVFSKGSIAASRAQATFFRAFLGCLRESRAAVLPAGR